MSPRARSWWTRLCGARRLTTIPHMALAEAIETSRIRRVAGLTGRRTAVAATRPFRPSTRPFPTWG
jgi:predicted ATPase with chaperone activity